MDRRPLIRTSEASAILGVSEVALRKCTDEGKISAFAAPGGHWRYSEEPLQEFMGTTIAPDSGHLEDVAICLRVDRFSNQVPLEMVEAYQRSRTGDRQVA